MNRRGFLLSVVAASAAASIRVYLKGAPQRRFSCIESDAGYCFDQPWFPDLRVMLDGRPVDDRGLICVTVDENEGYAIIYDDEAMATNRSRDLYKRVDGNFTVEGGPKSWPLVT